MNREIKFRAWNGEVMVEVDSSTYWLGQNGCVFDYVNQTEHVWPVMQYTGLKDKNGEDIYEDDIIRLHEYADVRVPVVFKSGAFCVHGFNWNEKTCEVIGNIYQNPELV